MCLSAHLKILLQLSPFSLTCRTGVIYLYIYFFAFFRHEVSAAKRDSRTTRRASSFVFFFLRPSRRAWLALGSRLPLFPWKTQKKQKQKKLRRRRRMITPVLQPNFIRSPFSSNIKYGQIVQVQYHGKITPSFFFLIGHCSVCKEHFKMSGSFLQYVPCVSDDFLKRFIE